MEDTLFCVIIDTKYNAFILPYLYGKGRANYQNNPETRAYYIDLPDNIESTTIRIALYIKSSYTTFWIWWHKALEKKVELSSNWATLEEEREVRHINLGFYEEWLKTKAQLKYMAKTYTQTFTKIYMVTKPDFVVKPDTEYVVIIMRVDGEFRTIVCPREIFLETRLGDIIMGMKDDELESLGLGDANISGFSEGRISPYIYGLITMSDATSTTWSKVVAAITQNTSGVRIASIVQMSKILLPKDIVKMIPLNVLPQQGKSLPGYMSPEASIWAAMVGFVTEVGRLLCELFMALANFLAKLIETIAEWGLKLLGALLEALGAAKYLFAMALCVWSWAEAAMFVVDFALLLGVILPFVFFDDYIDVGAGCVTVNISMEYFDFMISVYICSTDYYGFPIATLGIELYFCFSIGGAEGHANISLANPFIPFMAIEQHFDNFLSSTKARKIEVGPGTHHYREMEAHRALHIAEHSIADLISGCIALAVGTFIVSISKARIMRLIGMGIYAVGLALLYMPQIINVYFAHVFLEPNYASANMFLNAFAFLLYMWFVLPLLLAGTEVFWVGLIPSIVAIIIDIAIIWAELSAEEGLDQVGLAHIIFAVSGIITEIIVSYVEIYIHFLFKSCGVEELEKFAKAKKMNALGYVFIPLIFLGIFAFSLWSALEAKHVEKDAELQPPSITIDSWNFNNTTGELLFDISIEEQGEKTFTSGAGTISSSIMDFGIIIIEKDPNGDFGTPSILMEETR